MIAMDLEVESAALRATIEQSSGRSGSVSKSHFTLWCDVVGLMSLMPIYRLARMTEQPAMLKPGGVALGRQRPPEHRGLRTGPLVAAAGEFSGSRRAGRAAAMWA